MIENIDPQFMIKLSIYLIIVMTILSLVIKRSFNWIPKFIHYKSPDTCSVKSIARYLAINAAVLLFAVFLTKDLPVDIAIIYWFIYAWTIFCGFPNSGLSDVWEIICEMIKNSSDSSRAIRRQIVKKSLKIQGGIV